MKLISLISPEEKKIFFIPFLLFIVILLAEVITILILNSGLIVYTTDDAYIHLALAENILKGHYGVNLQEYSSPSSSILWPLILAPFTGLSISYLMPLIVNTLSAIGTMFIFFLLKKEIFLKESSGSSKFNKIALLFLILLIPAANLIGSLFSGMEHTIQIFFTVLIIWGLITAIQQKYISKWLLAAIIIAPLVRYENLALSFASLIFLYFAGYKKQAVLIFIFITALTASFSVFLLNLELEPLPLSVFQKSSVVSSGSINSILENFKTNIFNPRCSLLLVGVFVLSYLALSRKRNKEERLLAGCFALAILLHLLICKHGRYMVYIWTASVLTFLFLSREWLIKVIAQNSFFKTAALASIITILFSYYYIFNIITIPVASNNIYEQQYQMHRFITEYYKKPVAVNDLGYVSYRNNNYVLDLIGLASPEALNYRRINDKTDWIDTLSRRHNVELAIIYDDWFDKIPGSWYKAAELSLGKIKLSPSRYMVSFYLLNNDKKDEVVKLLKTFRETLPKGVKLTIWD
ncbi:MAG: hypothetical protein Q7S39_01455 [Ignavibacteria bacterium]|nr:hypothetical protein [Ignavibacteria bacterium]